MVARTRSGTLAGEIGVWISSLARFGIPNREIRAFLRVRFGRGEVATREQYEGNYKNFPLRELHFRLEFLIITGTGELQIPSKRIFNKGKQATQAERIE
jgi:hypothetical protein